MHRQNDGGVDPDGWAVWSKHVLNELERQGEVSEDIQDKLHLLHLDVVSLKARAAVWGALAGFIPVVLGLLVELYLKKG